LFHKTTDLFTNDIQVIEQVGEGIVPLIESGNIASTEMKALLQLYLKPMLDANIDYLVLGCTHYPYLVPQLLEILPSHVKIIDSGEAVAKQTKAVLRQHELLNNTTNKPSLQFYSNGNPKVMSQLLGEGFTGQYLDF